MPRLRFVRRTRYTYEEICAGVMIHCPDWYEDPHPASFAPVTDLISEQKNAYGIDHGF
jgi:hypothetical protein